MYSNVQLFAKSGSSFSTNRELDGASNQFCSRRFGPRNSDHALLLIRAYSASAEMDICAPPLPAFLRPVVFSPKAVALSN